MRRSPVSVRQAGGGHLQSSPQDPQRRAQGLGGGGGLQAPPPPPCDIPSGCCFFTGPWTVTRSSLRMLRWVAAFCRPLLRPVLPLVSFPRSRSAVVGVPGVVLVAAGVAPPPPPHIPTTLFGSRGWVY